MCNSCIASLFTMFAKFSDQIKLMIIKYILENTYATCILSFINIENYNSIFAYVSAVPEKITMII